MNPTARTLLLLGVMMLVVIAAGGALWWAKRRLSSRDDGGGPGGPALSLGEIRAMRDRGDIDDEEYQRLRGVMLRAWGAAGGAGPDKRELCGGTPEGEG